MRSFGMPTIYIVQNLAQCIQYEAVGPFLSNPRLLRVIIATRSCGIL